MPSRSLKPRVACKKSGVSRHPSQRSGKHLNPDDDLPNLRTHKYEGRELARLLRRNATIPIFDKISPVENEEIQSGFPEDDGRGNTPEKTRLTKDFMNFFFKVLDTAFFFDSITTKGIRLVLESDPGRKRKYEGWHIDCGIEESVNLEMSETGWRPRADQLERWGIEGVAGRDEQSESEEEEDDEDEGDEDNEEHEPRLCCTLM